MTDAEVLKHWYNIRRAKKRERIFHQRTRRAIFRTFNEHPMMNESIVRQNERLMYAAKFPNAEIERLYDEVRAINSVIRVLLSNSSS